MTQPAAQRQQMPKTWAVGRDTGRGNLLAIQPCLTLQDYSSEARFHARLAGYLSVARQLDWLGEKTVAVFPEYVGTWLLATGEGSSVLQAETLRAALRALILRHAPHLAWHLVHAASDGRIQESLFRLKARRMAKIYHHTFSRLASGYGVTVVAGSIVLPCVTVQDGMPVVGRGPLYNLSLVYRPDGTAYDTPIGKAFPTQEERCFTASAAVAELPVLDTPAGRLAVLICADAWQPAAYQALQDRRPELVAVPAYLSEDGVWDRPWAGYNGSAPPADVDPLDVGMLTEGQAWLRYGPPARMKELGASAGVTVFLRGKQWNLGSDGPAILVRDGEVCQAENTVGAALANCWLYNRP